MTSAGKPRRSLNAYTKEVFPGLCIKPTSAPLYIEHEHSSIKSLGFDN